MCKVLTPGVESFIVYVSSKDNRGKREPESRIVHSSVDNDLAAKTGIRKKRLFCWEVAVHLEN